MTFAKGWSAIQPKHDAEGGRWQQASAAVYAFAGGYADATGYLLVHTFTGHVTGNLILLAIALQHQHWHEISPQIVAIVAFLCATGAGFRIARLHAAKAGYPRSPWVLLLAQSVLLVGVCLPAVRHSSRYGLLLVAGLCLALGLQNGVATSSGGVSLHATFLSGDLTTLVKLYSQDRGGTRAIPRRKTPALLSV